jgi:hypothetical protein
MAQPYDKTGSGGKKTLLTEEDLQNMAQDAAMEMWRARESWELFYVVDSFLKPLLYKIFWLLVWSSINSNLTTHVIYYR